MSGEAQQPYTEQKQGSHAADLNPQPPASNASAADSSSGSSPAPHQPKWRKRLLWIAAALLVLAFFWRLALEQNGVEGKLIRALQAHGYTVIADDLYPAAAYHDASIRALLPNTELSDAVAASKQAGFPSDVDRTGQVVLYMAALSNGDVITLFVIDRDIELAFVQTPNTDLVYPVWED